MTSLTSPVVSSPRSSRWNRLARRWLPGWALGLGLASGCINDDVLLYEVAVSGSASAPSQPTAAGVLHLQFHHQRSFGRDSLAHPLGEFANRTRPSATLPIPFNETILYPTDAGEGLLVYGWLDIDGDGILCAPGQASEPAGITVPPEFPRHQLSLSLNLDVLCAGPERLFP